MITKPLAPHLIDKLNQTIGRDGNPIFRVGMIAKYTVQDARGKYTKRDLPLDMELMLERVYAGKRVPLIAVFAPTISTTTYVKVELPYDEADRLVGFDSYLAELLEEDSERSVDDIKKAKEVIATDTTAANWDNPLFGSW